MSFSDDLVKDLQSVFFADFQHTATISGVQVVGYLDLTAHQWAEIDSSQRIFFAPAANFPTLSRGLAMTIDGVNYTYVRKIPNGALLGIVVAPE